MCQYIVHLDLASTRLPANIFLEKKNALTYTHNEDDDYEVMITIIMIINKIHI
jgi:hypothetical protein